VSKGHIGHLGILPILYEIRSTMETTTKGCNMVTICTSFSQHCDRQVEEGWWCFSSLFILLNMVYLFLNLPCIPDRNRSFRVLSFLHVSGSDF
jgi:hypothetical protein